MLVKGGTVSDVLVTSSVSVDIEGNVSLRGSVFVIYFLLMVVLQCFEHGRSFASDSS
jgi:hypothetical protein